ncbi:hypothetical protein [Corallococcus sp. 4LFB]|uniref:hypothetical protein n=1 Tax=Corallococcus sp. 4LFB TaxID=3383249 RepID=UPI0039750E98
MSSLRKDTMSKSRPSPARRPWDHASSARSVSVSAHWQSSSTTTGGRVRRAQRAPGAR